MHRSTASLLLTLLMQLGCSLKQDDAESASTGDTTSTTDATLGHSSAPPVASTTDEDTFGGIPNGTMATTAENPPAVTTSGANATEGSSSSAGSSGGLEATACGLMCAHAGECRLDDDPAACTLLCEEKLAAASPACAAASETLLTCIASMTCEQLALALDGQLDHPCGSEQIDRDDACAGAPDSCDTGGGGDVNGTSCSVETLCPGDPLRSMTCDTESCQCFEEDQLIGSCAADGACMDLSGLGAKALSCCGFPGVPDVGP